MDAYMIEANDILDQAKPPTGSDVIDIALWETKNEIMHTRILQSIASHVQETISWEDSTLAAELRVRITSTFGLSIAEERLMTVKALLDINPQGNYPAMIRDFQRIAAKLKRMDLFFDDILHDIFICSLGQWQQSFVRTKLDEFFSCGRGPIKNLDIATFADQLVARSSHYSNKYIPQHPQVFKLETRYRISPTESKDSSRTSTMVRTRRLRVQRCFVKHATKDTIGQIIVGNCIQKRPLNAMEIQYLQPLTIRTNQQARSSSYETIRKPNQLQPYQPPKSPSMIRDPGGS
jgi:hypothetical protein